MLTPDLAAIESGVKGLLVQGCLSGAELVAMARLMVQMEAAFAHHARLLDLADEAGAEGYLSSRAWLTAATRMSGPAASAVLRRGRYAYACDATREAWEAGRITTEHVDAMEFVRRHARDDAAFARFEPALLAVALAGDVADVRDTGRKFLDALVAARAYADAQARREREAAAEAAGSEPAGSEPGCASDPDDECSDGNELDEIDDASRLEISDRAAGTYVIAGHLNEADAAQLLAALDAEVDRLHTEGDRRPRSERLAEALVSIARRANSQDRNAGRNTPHIVIHVDLHTWLGEKLGPIVTTSGVRLSRAQMLGLACEAIIWVATVGGQRQVLDLHRGAHPFNRAQRRALEARDGVTCCFPGCSVPASRTVAHHIDWWQLGGPTNLDNAILLCHRHHALVHERRWTIEKTPTGFAWFDAKGVRRATFVRRPPLLADAPDAVRRR